MSLSHPATDRATWQKLAGDEPFPVNGQGAGPLVQGIPAHLDQLNFIRTGQTAEMLSGFAG
jgi:hypothetical protein